MENTNSTQTKLALHSRFFSQEEGGAYRPSAAKGQGQEWWKTEDDSKPTQAVGGVWGFGRDGSDKECSINSSRHWKPQQIHTRLGLIRARGGLQGPSVAHHLFFGFDLVF